MPTIRVSSILTLAGFCLASTGVIAGEEWRYVSADARWALIVRVSDLLESETGAALTETHWDESAERWRESIQRDFGIDPYMEVSTVILFGTGGDRENGVVIMLGDFERDDATADLIAKDGYGTFDRDGNPVHVWDNGAASYPAPGVVVLGRRMEAVVHAVDTMEGRVSRMAPERLFGPLGYMEKGGLFAAFSDELSTLQEIPPRAAILRHARRLRVAAGEGDEHFRGSVRLEISAEEEAIQIENILRGFSGFARLGEDMRDPFSVFFRHASIEREKDVVRVEFEIPFDDLAFRRPPHRRMNYEFRRGE